MGSSKASYGAMGMCVMMMIAIAIAMMMPGGVAAQGPAAAPPATDCIVVIGQLSDCLPFVMGQAAVPVATCCSNLSSLVASTNPCLCQLYNTTFTEPLGVNVTQALLLPQACNVTTPPTSLCAAIGIPVPGPASSTAPAPAAPSSTKAPTPATSPSPSAPSSMPTPATTPSPIAPSGAAVPSGPPAGLEPSSSTAPPPNPSSAPHIVAKNGAIVASSLVAIAFLLS